MAGVISLGRERGQFLFLLGEKPRLYRSGRPEGSLVVCQPRHRSEGNTGHLHPTGACLRVRTGRYEAFKSTGCRIGEVRQIVTREGGGLLVTTSRRTSREAADVIEAGMPANAFFYRWTPGGQSNPYPAILGLADRFIVTGESISMLMEVVRQGKPLAIYPLPSRKKSVRQCYRHVLQSLLFPLDEAAKESGGWREGLGDRLVRLGLLRYRRDFSLFHQQLIARNLAVRFGAPFSLFKAHPLTISPW